MRIAKVFQALVLGLVVIAAVSCANRPIHDVDNHPIPAVAQKLSMKEIEQAIIQAGAARRWRMDRLGEGSLRAKLSDEKEREAIVEITFSQTAYSIRLNSSERLKEQDGTINRRYNGWIRRLEKDIEDRLYTAGLARQ